MPAIFYLLNTPPSTLRIKQKQKANKEHNEKSTYKKNEKKLADERKNMDGNYFKIYIFSVGFMSFLYLYC